MIMDVYSLFFFLLVPFMYSLPFPLINYLMYLYFPFLLVTLCTWWLYTSGPEGCTILHPETPVLGLTQALQGYGSRTIYTVLAVVVLSSLSLSTLQNPIHNPLVSTIEPLPLLLAKTLDLPQVTCTKSPLIHRTTQVHVAQQGLSEFLTHVMYRLQHKALTQAIRFRGLENPLHSSAL